MDPVHFTPLKLFLLSKHLWTKSTDSDPKFAPFYCIIFSSFFVLGGLEVAVKLCYEQHFRSYWILASFVAIEIVANAVFVPAIFLVVQPSLNPIISLQWFAIKFIVENIHRMAKVSMEALGNVSSFWFQVSANGADRDTNPRIFQAEWFKITLAVLSLLSILFWTVFTALELEKQFNRYAPLFFPSWISHTPVYSLILLSIVLLLCPSVGSIIRIHDEMQTHQLYFNFSVIFALNLVTIIEHIWSLQTRYHLNIINIIEDHIQLDFDTRNWMLMYALRISLLLLLFLFIYSILLPILGDLSMSIEPKVRDNYRTWRNLTEGSMDLHFIERSTLLQLILTPYPIWYFGNYVSAHPIITAIHMIVASLIVLCKASYQSLLWNISSWSFLYICNQYDLSFTHPDSSAVLHLVIFVDVALACAFVVIPLLVYPAFHLVIDVWPSSIETVMDNTSFAVSDWYFRAKDEFSSIVQRPFDQTNLQPVFGWLLFLFTSIFLICFYGPSYISSPISPFIQLKNEILSRERLRYWLFEEISPAATEPSLASTRAFRDTPALIGHIFVDYLVAILVISQLLLILGRLSSKDPKSLCRFILCAVVFSSCTPRPNFMKTTHPLISLAILGETCLLFCLVLLPLLLRMLEDLFEPHLLPFGTKVIYPFERLWFLYMRRIRIVLRWYYMLKDLMDLRIQPWFWSLWKEDSENNKPFIDRSRYVVRERKFFQ